MPRRCRVCAHPRRQELERAYLTGVTLRDIGRRFRLDKSTVLRHCQIHLSEKLAKAHDAKEQLSAEGLLAKLADLEANLQRLANRAEQARDWRGAIAGNRELLRALELLARLIGELRDRQVKVGVWIDSLDELSDEELKRRVLELERQNHSRLPLAELDQHILELQHIREVRATEALTTPRDTLLLAPPSGECDADAP